MKKYTYKGFYGDYGTIIEHNDGAAMLDCYVNGRRVHHRKYNTLAGAKRALTRMSDSYTLTEKGVRES